MSTTALFDTTDLSAGSDSWRIARDGDRIGALLYGRHYSARAYRDRRPRSLFVGPGEKLVLISHDDQALFVWRKFRDDSGQQGVNCAVFRNESCRRSSNLITEADHLADSRWPGERHYTYVSPSKVRSTNPGYCFQVAGWSKCGWTKGGHGRERLLILERGPASTIGAVR